MGLERLESGDILIKFVTNSAPSWLSIKLLYPQERPEYSVRVSPPNSDIWNLLPKLATGQVELSAGGNGPLLAPLYTCDRMTTISANSGLGANRPPGAGELCDLSMHCNVIPGHLATLNLAFDTLQPVSTQIV